MNMKKRIFSIILTLMILFLLIIPASITTILNKSGNTSANLNNGGYAAEQDDWIYFADGMDLYKISKITGDNIKISSQTYNYNEMYARNIQYLNVVGKWIYYYVYTEGFFKIRIDGSDEQKIFNLPGYENYPNFMYVSGDAYSGKSSALRT